MHPKSSPLKDLSSVDKAKVGELIMRLEMLGKQLDISLGGVSEFDFTRLNDLQRSEFNASQFKTVKPRHRSVKRAKPCQEADWSSASKWPENFSSQDTTQDQSCIEIDLEKSPIDEAKSLAQDILSMPMTLRQLKSSTPPLPTSQKESRGAACPLESSRRGPVYLGNLQLDYLKLILEKAHCSTAAIKDTLHGGERWEAAKEVHCRGCCYGAEVIVTSKHNPITTPSTRSKSKSPGSLHTSRGRLTSSRLLRTRRDDDLVSSRSIRSSRSVRGGLYDDNLYRLVAELEQIP
jgi:hypothetical protein